MAGLSADVAQQRQQQFRKLPGTLPHESASLSIGSILRLEPGQREGFERRMSSIGSAKEDFSSRGSKLWMAGEFS